MYISKLDYYTLHHLFSVLSNDYDPSKAASFKRLVTLSSVCRCWRTLLLPHLYRQVCVRYLSGKTRSNTKLIYSTKHDRSTRTLAIMLKDVYIDSAEFVTVLKEAGAEQAIWPQVKRLVIESNISLAGYIDHFTSDRSAVKEAAGILSKHFPQIRELECKQTVKESLWSPVSRYPCLLTPELAGVYSAQLRKADMGLYAHRLFGEHSFPQQITHLSIDMGSYEKQMLPKIFAPSLKSLSIERISPDVTWNWFASGNGNDVWFNNLVNLQIEFYEFEIPRAIYRNNDLSNLSTNSFGSDYRAVAKRVHFPILEILVVSNYPYMDDSFYKLFEGCALKRIDVSSPKGIQQNIPLQMLASLLRMDVAIYYEQLIPQLRGDGQMPAISMDKAYEQAVASLMSTPSTVHSASLMLPVTQPIPLPGTLAWHSIRALELGFQIDMKSIFAILAQMPKLRQLKISMSASYLNDACDKDASASGENSRQLRVVNTHLECILLRIEGCSVPTNTSLQCLLTSILPLTPSLLRVTMDRSWVSAAKEVVADPGNFLEWIAQQLEILGL